MTAASATAVTADGQNIRTENLFKMSSERNGKLVERRTDNISSFIRAACELEIPFLVHTT